MLCTKKSDSNMGNWMFVYRDIQASLGGQSQSEQLAVLGLDQNINSLSLERAYWTIVQRQAEVPEDRQTC